MYGQSLGDREKFIALIRSLKVGDKVKLVLYREKKTRNVELTLPERPIFPGDFPSDTPRSLLLEK